MLSCRLAAVALALALALSSAGCLFDESGLGGAGQADRSATPTDARDEQGRPLDTRADAARDGAPKDSTRDGGPRPEGAPPPDTTRDGGALSDTTRDNRPSPDTTRDTAPRPDTTRDTAPPPDTTRDSGPPVYINESFGSGPGVLVANRGSWSYSNGRANQTATAPNGPTLSGTVPVADYVVESVVRIHGIQGLANAGEGAGIAARIQPPLAGQASNPARMYGCILSPDQKRVYLIESNGSSTLYSVMASSSSVIVAINTPYRILLTVKGNQISCSVPTLGVNISDVDNSITSAGRAGLVTLYAHASWEYLTVTGL